MNTSVLIPIALPKRATAGIAVAQLTATMAGTWLAPLPAVLILAAGLLLVLGTVAQLWRADRLVALRMAADGSLAGRTAAGADFRIDLVDHRVIGGRAVGLALRWDGRRTPQSLLLLPGDQAESDLRALRVWLRHRQGSAPAGTVPSISAVLP